MKISDRPDRGWELALDDPFPGQAPREASSPLYVRIVRAVTRDIRRGRLVPGQALPGSRTLAEQLGVHRNTVLAAYAELAAEGWIETRPAHHTVVCQALPETPRGVRAPGRPPRANGSASICPSARRRCASRRAMSRRSAVSRR